MEELGGEDRGSVANIRTVALASCVGTFIEYYDFLVYGTASALVLGGLFFPNFSPLAGSLAAFGTFTAGFVARPVGGIIIGHFGDRLGRKSMLVLTLLTMGVASFLIGLLPTYEAIGVWAPVLLVVLRLLQGIAVGGEWGGAALMVLEHSPAHRRGFYGSWIQMGIPASLMFSTAIIAIFASLPEEQFLSWGWRVPFLISIILAVVGLFIRLRIMESPVFGRIRQTSTETRMPLLEALRRYPKNILTVMGMRFAEQGPYYIFTVFILTYATEQLGLSRDTALIGVVIGSAANFVGLPLFGALSDRIGRRVVYMGGAAFTALFAFPFFWMVNSGSPILVWLALALGLLIGHAAVYGTQASFFPELFGARVRYSGVSIGYQLVSIPAGGLVPTIATALLLWSGGQSWSLALYMIAMGLITFIAAYFAPETYQESIDAEQRSSGIVGKRI